jgi:hypothetical protein
MRRAGLGEPWCPQQDGVLGRLRAWRPLFLRWSSVRRRPGPPGDGPARVTLTTGRRHLRRHPSMAARRLSYRPDARVPPLPRCRGTAFSRTAPWSRSDPSVRRPTGASPYPRTSAWPAGGGAAHGSVTPSGPHCWPRTSTRSHRGWGRTPACSPSDLANALPCPRATSPRTSRSSRSRSSHVARSLGTRGSSPLVARVG